MFEIGKTHFFPNHNDTADCVFKMHFDTQMHTQYLSCLRKNIAIENEYSIEQL